MYKLLQLFTDNTMHSRVKGELSLKIYFLHIYLYFIATQYLLKYALMEDIDNWIWSFNHILKSSKIIFNRLVIKDV